MKTRTLLYSASVFTLAIVALQAADKIDTKNLVTGKAAFAEAKDLKPGTYHKITAADLPKPFETPSGRGFGPVAARGDLMPKAPAGFKVELYAEVTAEGKAASPRKIITAPNGDLFTALSNQNMVAVYRGLKDGKFEQTSIFATGLNRPYGIAFYPSGANPQWVYVANTNGIVRFPYKNGDLKASAAAQVLASDLPAGANHWTRDIVFSKDGKRLFVAVGSASNFDDPDTHPSEKNRANVLEYTPEGKFVKVYAAGIRNPAGMNLNPTTGEVWVSVNERDELGDNLVPDYITSVKEGGFYGWPWYYIGGNPEPRLNGAHPEMKDKVIVPDVLIQPHSASLAFTFYEGKMFPAEYQGDLFAAEHGSWNRAVKSGHEVVRVPLEKGKASGVYQDFLTGFTNAQGQPWGRPVGVAVGKDGSLFVTDDGANVIWRVSR